MRTAHCQMSILQCVLTASSLNKHNVRLISTWWRKTTCCDSANLPSVLVYGEESLLFLLIITYTFNLVYFSFAWTVVVQSEDKCVTLSINFGSARLIWNSFEFSCERRITDARRPYRQNNTTCESIIAQVITAREVDCRTLAQLSFHFKAFVSLYTKTK